MTDSDPLNAHLRPTANRPLLGLTVLVIEDSRFACDAMRLLCLRSGARIRRADCISSARRHLRVYRPTVLVVDVGLPDGSGIDLIAELSQATPRVDVILATSGDPFVEEAVIAAGADGFLPKPITSVAGFQQAILANLPRDRQPPGPRSIADEPVQPDPVAYRDDMAHAAGILADGEAEMIGYVAQFLSGVAHSAGDDALYKAASALSKADSPARPADLAHLSALVDARMAEAVAI